MRIQLQVDFTSAENVSIFSPSPEGMPVGVNVSNIDNIYESNTPRGFKGFQLSATKDKPLSRLDGLSNFYTTEGYPGYLSRRLSDEDGYFSIYLDIPIVLSGDVPNVIYVGFDIVNREYATEFAVYATEVGDVVTYTDNRSPVVAIDTSDLNIPVGSTGVVLILQIRKWSKANASAKVTMCAGAYSALFDMHDLNELVLSDNARETQLRISPGVITQYLDGVLYDRYGILRSLATQNLLLKGAKTYVRAIDADQVYSLGIFHTTDWNVKSDSSEVTVTGADPSVTFENIQVSALNVQSRTLHELLQIAFKSANVTWMYEDDSLSTRCKNCIIPDSWHQECTLKEFLHDVCVLGMLNVHWSLSTFVVGRCY